MTIETDTRKRMSTNKKTDNSESSSPVNDDLYETSGSSSKIKKIKQLIKKTQSNKKANNEEKKKKVQWDDTESKRSDDETIEDAKNYIDQLVSKENKKKKEKKKSKIKVDISDSDAETKPKKKKGEKIWKDFEKYVERDTNRIKRPFKIISFAPVYTTSLNLTTDTCMICHDSLSDKCTDCTTSEKTPSKDKKKAPEKCDLKEGQCGHGFHAHCIDKWTTSQKYSTPKCPIDNLPWKLKTVHSGY